MTVFIITNRKAVSGFIHLLTLLRKRTCICDVFDTWWLVDTLITRHRDRNLFGTQ